MLSTQQADDDSGYAFVAKLDNARNVSNILKAIHFKDVRSIFASMRLDLEHRNASFDAKLCCRKLLFCKIDTN